MAGIIFNEGVMTPVTRGIDRRRFIAAASGVVASFAAHSTLARQNEATTPDASEKLDEIGLSGPKRLAELLSLVPIDLLTPEDGYGVPFFYADLARQFKSLGIEPEFFNEDAEDRTPFRIVAPLATASPAFERAAAEAFTTAIGFQPWATGQSLHAGAPADQLTLFQGGMDLDQLPKSWKASGYERVRTDDSVEIWTVAEDGILDQASTMGAFFMPSLNNATVLDTGVVMFANTLDRLQSAIETADMGTGSILDDEGINAVVAAMPADIVSAIAVTPEYASQSPVSLGDGATPDLDIESGVGEELPSYRAFAMGITAGFMDGAPQRVGEGTLDASQVADLEPVIPEGGVIFARLAAASEEDAELIVDIVETRWNEGRSLVTARPYTDYLTVEEAGADGGVAAVDFVPVAAPSVWIDFLLQRDLAPFARSR